MKDGCYNTDMEKPPHIPTIEKPQSLPPIQEIPPVIESPSIIAEEMILKSRWERLSADPRVLKGMQALARTLANAGITIADIVPGAGDILSWSADVLKFIGPHLNRFGIPNLDLTPTVSKKVAITTELFEFGTFGITATHIIETLLQLTREDWKNIKEALKAMGEILAEENERRRKDKRQIDEAMKVFKKEK
jgi:hypothetical protein